MISPAIVAPCSVRHSPKLPLASSRSAMLLSSTACSVSRQQLSARAVLHATRLAHAPAPRATRVLSSAMASSIYDLSAKARAG